MQDVIHKVLNYTVEVDGGRLCLNSNVPVG